MKFFKERNSQKRKKRVSAFFNIQFKQQQQQPNSRFVLEVKYNNQKSSQTKDRRIQQFSDLIDQYFVGLNPHPHPQSLYGQKLYDNNLSQRDMLEKEIQFPNQSQISNEVKIFIRRCLTYQVDSLPDVLQLSEDNYLKSYSKRTTLTSSSILSYPK